MKLRKPRHKEHVDFFEGEVEFYGCPEHHVHLVIKDENGNEVIEIVLDDDAYLLFRKNLEAAGDAALGVK